MNDKARLRKVQRAQRLAPAVRAQQSDAIAAQLLSLDEVIEAKAVALFAGIAHEPDMRASFEALASMERWLPRVVDPTALGWSRVDDWDALVPSRMRIPEPTGAVEPELPSHVVVVLVPGVAFDAQGGRLGWGAGYYDRVLRRATHALRVGVTLSTGLVDHVPMEPHDVRMHLVVSPNTTFRVVGDE